MPTTSRLSITIERSVRNEVLGTSPKLWMNLQATYDLDRAEKARDAA